MSSNAQNLDDKMAYVMLVLKHTDIPKPDWKAIAEEGGINTPNNAQRRFRAVVKRAGFDLVGDRIVGPDSSANVSSPTTGNGTATTSSDSSPAPTPQQRRRTKPATSSTTVRSRSAKRKIDDVTGSEKTTIRTTTYRMKVSGSGGLQHVKEEDANDGVEVDDEGDVEIVKVVETKRPPAKKATSVAGAMTAPPAKKRKVSNYSRPSVEDVADDGDNDEGVKEVTDEGVRVQ